MILRMFVAQLWVGLRFFVRVITVRTFMQEAALPVILWPGVGRAAHRCGGTRVMTVADDPAGVEGQLAAGVLCCPECRGRLAGWGWARPRLLRDEAGARWLVRPRRTRCAGCGATHVLLPVGVLVRRADTVAVVGEALAGKASGLGARPIAAAVDRPLGTVKGWLRRFAGRAEQVRAWFIGLLVAVAADPVVPDVAATTFADAVAAIDVAATAVADRFALGEVTPWRVACAVTAGRLLSPVWPPQWINTSSPWLAAL